MNDWCMYFIDCFASRNVLGDNKDSTAVVTGFDFNIHRVGREVFIIT